MKISSSPTFCFTKLNWLCFSKTLRILTNLTVNIVYLSTFFEEKNNIYTLRSKGKYLFVHHMIDLIIYLWINCKDNSLPLNASPTAIKWLKHFRTLLLKKERENWSYIINLGEMLFSVYNFIKFYLPMYSRGQKNVTLNVIPTHIMVEK